MKQFGNDSTIRSFESLLLHIPARATEYPMSENLTVRRDGNLWTCADDEHDLRAVGFIDLVIGIHKAFGIHKFTVTFDCEGSEIDGATATFDFGPPDSISDI